MPLDDADDHALLFADWSRPATLVVQTDESLLPSDDPPIETGTLRVVPSRRSLHTDAVGSQRVRQSLLVQTTALPAVPRDRLSLSFENRWWEVVDRLDHADGLSQLTVQEVPAAPPAVAASLASEAFSSE